ncbi:exported hypothetical protein [Gammaproteobacteria bacterium]
MRTKILAGAALIWVGFLVMPVCAEEPQGNSVQEASGNKVEWEAWKLTLVKLMTYPMINSIDDISSAYYLTGSLTDALSVAFFMSASKSAIYATHEYAWNRLAPLKAEDDKVARTVYKSVTYRIASMSYVFGMSILYTGSLSTSATFVLLDALYGASVYFVHEFLWNHYGPAVRVEKRD